MAEAVMVPAVAPEPASPVALALRRFARRPLMRVGLVALAALALVAIYAPFLASEVAVLWRDDAGWRSPAVASLFNARVYGERHDLLFNLIALLLPVLLLAGIAARRRVSLARRIAIGAGIVVAAWIACQLPVMRSDGQWRAPWRDRPDPIETASAAHAGRVHPALAVFPLVPHAFDATYAGAVLKAPGSVNAATGGRFWLGTDVRGHDVLAQMGFGARISLTIGFVATGLSLAIGTLIGAISGYAGGWVDLALQRVVEIMLCFPTFILIVTIVAATSRSIFIIMAVLGLTGWAGTARLVRGEFLSQSVRDYVAAGQALGLGGWRIMFRHILPNALTPLLITATFGIAGAVATESGLSYLGLGDPNAPSWGQLLEQGRENISYAWLIYVPGLAVFALVSLLNLLGSGLSDALDPKSTA